MLLADMDSATRKARLRRWADALRKVSEEMERTHVFDEHSYPPDYVALVHIAWQRLYEAQRATKDLVR